jgi:hypothetical protein
VPLPINRDDRDVITLSEEVDDGRDEHQCKEVVANLDVEGDDGDYLDDEIEAEADDTGWRCTIRLITIILLLKVRPHVVMDLQWVASGGHFLKLVTHLKYSMKERPFVQSHQFQRFR